MIAKKKICFFCSTEQFIWKNVEGKKACKSCWAKHPKSKSKAAGQVSARPRQPIKQFSDKKTKENALYKILRDAYLKKHPQCEAAIVGICSRQPSNQVHHRRGRNKYLLDETTFLAVEDNCHHWIETHPEQSYEMGFSELRLKNYEDGK